MKADTWTREENEKIILKSASVLELHMSLKILTRNVIARTGLESHGTMFRSVLCHLIPG